MSKWLRIEQRKANSLAIMAIKAISRIAAFAEFLNFPVGENSFVLQTALAEID